MEQGKQAIFLVDDNVTNLTVGKNALVSKYNVITIPSGKKLLKMLERTKPDLILLDIEMPEMNGYDVIKIIKSDKNIASIPVVFLTAKSDSESELEGLSLGAVDYISKPFSPLLLSKRVELHLLVNEQNKKLQNYNNNLQEIVREKTNTVIELKNTVLRTMAELVECRDDVTGGHIERTQRYLQIMINSLIQRNLYNKEITTWDLELVLQSSQLHDVGKISIRDSVLQKPAKLTPEEFEEMKTHTTFGVDLLEKIEKNTSENKFLEHAKIFAGTHHEKWDGSGYPFGLKSDGIPLQGRLMSIADVYDALISSRPYKKPFEHTEAVRIIKHGKGTHFDPILVDLFLSISDEFDQVAKDIDADKVTK